MLLELNMLMLLQIREKKLLQMLFVSDKTGHAWLSGQKYSSRKYSRKVGKKTGILKKCETQYGGEEEEELRRRRGEEVQSESMTECLCRLHFCCLLTSLTSLEG